MGSLYLYTMITHKINIAIKAPGLTHDVTSKYRLAVFSMVRAPEVEEVGVDAVPHKFVLPNLVVEQFVSMESNQVAVCANDP
jgi:hypothetical protein